MTNFFIKSVLKHAVANDLGCKRWDQSRSCKRRFHTRERIYTLNTSAVIPAGVLLSILIIAINEPPAITFKRLWKTGCSPKIRKKSFMLK